MPDFPRMNKTSQSSNLWSDYYKPYGRKRMRYTVPPATREEIEEATREYILEGNKIDVLEPSGIEGKLEKFKRADDFLSEAASKIF